MRVHHVNNRYRWLSPGMLILLLYACSGNAGQPTVIVTSDNSTHALTSPTSTKIATPSPTQTKIPATRTPVPTLRAEAADARVLELLQTNSHCSLPCWWGITPGVTTTDEIQSILEPFLGAVVSDVRFEFSEAGGYLLMRPQPQNGFRIGIQYLAKDKIVTMVYVNTAITRDTYELIYDDPIYQEIMAVYTLEAMLTKYGKPDQILIRSFSDLAAEFNPTQTLLFYADIGIVVQYFSPNGLLIENSVFILPTCPPKGHISLRLFDPNAGMTLDDLLRLDDSYARYKDISVASNMDIDTFYEVYRKYDEKTLASSCPAVLKTPEEIWPNEYTNP